MTGRTRVGVVFGGPSREHGVSFFSARCLLENLPESRYEAVPVFVDKDGLWYGPEASRKAMEGAIARPGAEALRDGVEPGSEPAPHAEAVESFAAAFRAGAWDAVFPIVHGTFGEDGVLQGLLEALGIPYVGFGVAASAVGMDKALMKAVFAAAGLPQVRYTAFTRLDWRLEARRGQIEREIDELGLPVFVKPACAGSSVGVTKVKERPAIGLAVEAALRIDGKVLVEEGIDAREIECSVLESETGGSPEASLPGEIIPGHEFYDYEDKYIDGRSRSVIPADLAPGTCDDIRRLAVWAFEALDGAGFARVDFFLERSTGRVLLNELNSLPGFTPISMFPKMWEATGLPLQPLLERLVRSAFWRPVRGR